MNPTAANCPACAGSGLIGASIRACPLCNGDGMSERQRDQAAIERINAEDYRRATRQWDWPWLMAGVALGLVMFVGLLAVIA